MNEPAEQESWNNGVTLKRTRDGYTWTIAVSAEDASVEALRQASDKAMALDDLFTKRYGKQTK